MTLPAWVRRALDWLLTTDPHQRLRLTMTSLATALMLLCVLLFNALAWAGLARRDWMAWWTVAAVGGMFGVALFIRSGRALRLKDPSLTQFQLRVCAGLHRLAVPDCGAGPPAHAGHPGPDHDLRHLRHVQPADGADGGPGCTAVRGGVVVG